MISKLRTVFFSIIFIFFYYLIFNTGAIKYLAVGSDIIFVDYKDIIKALNCLNFNYESYSDKFEGPEALGCRGFSYGPIILYSIPFKNSLFYFYENILPILFIVLFTLAIVILINPKNKLSFTLCSLSLFNPATLLMIERMNIDIFFILILIFISYNKIYFLNWGFVVYSFLSKFYPFIYGMIIFLENKLRKKIQLIGIFFLLSFSSLAYMFFYFDEYKYIMNSGWAMGLHYIFSLKTLPKVFTEIFELHYGFLLLIFYLSFVFLLIKFIKKYKSKVKTIDFSFHEKLFIISGNVILFCFVTFSNAYYREVFLILTIPYLNRYADDKWFKFILNILIIKFCFNFIYIFFLNFETFYYAEDLRVYTNSFLLISFIKGILDLCLVLLISTIVMTKNIFLINHYLQLKILQKY